MKKLRDIVNNSDSKNSVEEEIKEALEILKKLSNKKKEVNEVDLGQKQ